MALFLPASLELIQCELPVENNCPRPCVPNFVQVAAKVFIELVNGFLINPCPAVFIAYFPVAVIHHLFVYKPHVGARAAYNEVTELCERFRYFSALYRV